MRFKNKTVMITGSSRGIGKAIAIHFSKEGANLIICCKNNLEALEETGFQIENNFMGAQVDVTNIDSVTNAMDLAVKKFGNIDILINNAGNFINSTVKYMDKNTWQDVIDVNLTGVFNCTRAILNTAQANRIINISSVVAQIGAVGAANYAAAKAGVLGFTRAVAKEVIKKNITVNALVAGYINTGMWTELPEKLQAKILKTIPAGRPGHIDEITETVLFLASKGAGYITGQMINVNGGIYM